MGIKIFIAILLSINIAAAIVVETNPDKYAKINKIQNATIFADKFLYNNGSSCCSPGFGGSQLWKESNDGTRNYIEPTIGATQEPVTASAFMLGYRNDGSGYYDEGRLFSSSALPILTTGAGQAFEISASSATGYGDASAVGHFETNPSGVHRGWLGAGNVNDGAKFSFDAGGNNAKYFTYGGNTDEWYIDTSYNFYSNNHNMNLGTGKYYGDASGLSNVPFVATATNDLDMDGYAITNIGGNADKSQLTIHSYPSQSSNIWEIYTDYGMGENLASYFDNGGRFIVKGGGLIMSYYDPDTIIDSTNFPVFLGAVGGGVFAGFVGTYGGGFGNPSIYEISNTMTLYTNDGFNAGMIELMDNNLTTSGSVTANMYCNSTVCKDISQWGSSSWVGTATSSLNMMNNSISNVSTLNVSGIIYQNNIETARKIFQNYTAYIIRLTNDTLVTGNQTLFTVPQGKIGFLLTNPFMVNFGTSSLTARIMVNYSYNGVYTLDGCGALTTVASNANGILQCPALFLDSGESLGIEINTHKNASLRIQYALMDKTNMTHLLRFKNLTTGNTTLYTVPTGKKAYGLLPTQSETITPATAINIYMIYTNAGSASDTQYVIPPNQTFEKKWISNAGNSWTTAYSNLAYQTIVAGMTEGYQFALNLSGTVTTNWGYGTVLELDANTS